MIVKGVGGGYLGDWELIFWKYRLKLIFEEWERVSYVKS